MSGWAYKAMTYHLALLFIPLVFIMVAKEA